jgi:hypothetical protein
MNLARKISLVSAAYDLAEPGTRARETLGQILHRLDDARVAYITDEPEGRRIEAEADAMLSNIENEGRPRKLGATPDNEGGGI